MNETAEGLLEERAPWWRRFGAMEIDAVALMSTTVVMTLLGFGYWVVAARLYPPDQVGQASATINALVLLATLSQLNLGMVFVRFISAAGSAALRLVGYGYAAIAVLSLLIGFVFVLTPLHRVAATTGAGRFLLPLGVLALALFSVQDFVLTGFGAARWTPLENITFSTIKLLLLFVLSPLGTAAVVLSWVLPAALGVVVVTSILVRSRRCHAQGEPRLPQPRSLVTHIAGEYTAAVLATGSQYLLPLLIVHRLGPETFAYFTVPWLVITSVSMLLWNVATSVTAEASRSLDQAHALLRRAAYLTAAVAVSSTVVVVCGAPLLLAMVGRGYSEVGVVPLQLAALGLPFMVVPLLWSTLARLRRRPSLIAWSQGLAGGLSVVGALVLMPSLGLRGVALSFAGAQAIAAIVLFPGVRRGFRDLSSAARVIDLERLDPTVANVRG